MAKRKPDSWEASNERLINQRLIAECEVLRTALHTIRSITKADSRNHEISHEALVRADQIRTYGKAFSESNHAETAVAP